MISKTLIDPVKEWPASQKYHKFEPNGFCYVCQSKTDFILDMESNYELIKFKESLKCPLCNLIARQRAVITELVNTKKTNDRIWLQERLMSSSYEWAINNITDCFVIGTEYMPDKKSIPNIHHQDVEQLTFEDNSLDIIISQDVFEHVKNPWQGFKECYRVLSPGGCMIMTVPFPPDPLDNSIDRRKQGLPDLYHGIIDGPPPGSFLCYTDFGWDIIPRLSQIGYIVELKIYQDASLGWPAPILIFRLTKPDH